MDILNLKEMEECPEAPELVKLYMVAENQYEIEEHNEILNL